MHATNARKTTAGVLSPSAGIWSIGRTTDFAVADDEKAKIKLPESSGFSPGTAYNRDFAQVSEKARIEVMNIATELKDLHVSQACEKWLEQRSLYIRESTRLCYLDYIARIDNYFSAHFPDLVLKAVHIGHFVSYQKAHKRLHPASVNHDLNVLSQTLRMAGLWDPLRDHYRPLPLPELDPPKVMTEAEEDKFFEFASKGEEWRLAYWVASLTNNTTASGKELRMLQRGNVHREADPPYFQVPKNMKTPQRQRTIPMNERADEIMRRVLEHSAEEWHSTHPEHYVFPLRKNRGEWDPTKAASESWLKAQWKKLVDAALEAKVISFRIKPHNLRHQAITKMLDYGVPIETVRQIAGHGVDSLVTRHYHHARLETMAKAVNAIDPDKKRPTASPGNHNNKGERA